MAHAHNTLLRGLNAILQQAPYVPDASDRERFNRQDVKDLLSYVTCWAKMVQHHHWVEETFIFPELEKVMSRPGLMDDPKHQHGLFHDGMERILEYASTTTPEEYRWEGPDGMKAILDSFSKHLADHLYAEIDVFLSMQDLDGDLLKKTWGSAEGIAKQSGNLAMLVSSINIVRVN
jgi:hemerythrin-like domain-containing protein